MSYDQAKKNQRKTEPVFYTTAQAAKLLKLSPTEVRSLITQGRLAAQKDGRYYRILHKDVYVYLQSRAR